MHVVNPWKSYRQIATQTASPGQLVLMLYEGAIRFLERGLEGFSYDDPAELNMTVHNNLQRAQEIIRELNLALNMEQGGQFAATLRGLYDYFDRLLWESDTQKRPDGVKEVIRHLTVLRDAWEAMLNGKGLSAGDLPVPVPAAVSAA
jgi:flagellar secretion chaperone FliS